MMQLFTMQSVVSTVNDQWECDLADQLLQHWDHDPERAKYWRASANFVFFFKNSGLEYVLRFNHARERTRREIEAELSFVNYIAGAGLNLSKPVLSKAGSFVESVTTNLGEFHAVVFEKLPGEQIDYQDLTADQVVLSGKTLGDLHQAATDFGIDGRSTWQDHLNLIAQTVPLDDSRGLKQAFEGLKEQLQQLPINSRNFGLIHFDFETDNIIWDKGRPGIIDFDDCAGYWFTADIAFALRELFQDSAKRVDFQNELFQHFIAGYRVVRPLDDHELLQIPLFLKLHNFLMWVKLLRTLTPANPAGEPAWMGDLRTKLAAKIAYYKYEHSP